MGAGPPQQHQALERPCCRKTSTSERQTVPTPLTSVRFAPPPYSISLSKSLRNTQKFPQLTSSGTAFGGSWKMASDGPSSLFFSGQKSCRTKVSRIWIFCPEFCSEFPRIIWGVFVLRFMGDGDQKDSPKVPAIFQCKIHRQVRRNNPQKFSGERAK